MIHQLDPSEYHRALPVVEGIEHLLYVHAIIAGVTPGAIYVDDPVNPQRLLVSSPDGHFLVGDENDAAFNDALAEMIKGKIIPAGRAAGWARFNLQYHPNGWEEKLDAVFADTVVVKDYQHFYRFRRPRVDWRERLPAGLQLRRVDADLLQQDHRDNVARLRDHAEDSFGSVEAFLEHGFGFCILQGDDIASWCLCDCAIGSRCEIGIHTDPKYRRRGLATAAAAGAVEYCLSRGFTHIGWHCWSSNHPSAATAERVGFEQVMQHHGIFVWLNPVDGHLANGNLALMRNEFKKAAESYEKAFALRAAQAPDVRKPYLLANRAAEATYYDRAACAWALAGERDAALRNLERALDARALWYAGFY